MSTFDRLNRLRTRTAPASKTITRAQDAISRRRVLRVPEGARYAYPWDDANRCRAVVNPQHTRTRWTELGVDRKAGLNIVSAAHCKPTSP